MSFAVSGRLGTSQRKRSVAAIMVSLLVTGGHGGTLTQEKIGFAAELTANLFVYLAATLILLRVVRYSK